ncbi:energy-coupled thiamine transporter ThiT [Alkalicoccus halolimnae]|uniref:Energy-coupled thiamine transporter ThiT n=1 Tax=Alkalicoccus halolimnae TaxID=1667239 RepID=A0A5C7FLZ1_9BACI|nr:energy-coupled thiamine transporter ThiT [Alkalicoccus halolimnae]TXF87384.1 energy-coupled thiamine transporter ThiT [Alkalicoccus halolimnae]
MNRLKLVVMMEIALMTGLAVILDFLTLFRMPYGGSVTLSMLPIIVISYRRGVKAGVTTGVLFGLANLMFGPYIVHWIQALLEYPVAFAAAGLAGLFSFTRKTSVKKTFLYLSAGIAVAVGLRFIAHFVSGIVWFGEFAPEGVPVALYSFLYNLSYLGPTFILLLLIMFLFARSGRQLLHPEAG